MKLLDAINREGRIYIGAQSGFFFIGTRDEALKELPKISKFYKKTLRKTIDNRIVKYERNTEDSKRHKEEHFIREKMQYLREWEDFLDRDVIQIYTKDIGRGTAIIIDGKEIGNYWTYEEYKLNRGYGQHNNTFQRRVFTP